MLNELAPPSKSGGLWGIVSCPFVFQRVSASMELYPSLLILKYFISIYYYHIYIYMNFTAPGLCNKSVKRACIYIYIYIYQQKKQQGQKQYNNNNNNNNNKLNKQMEKRRRPPPLSLSFSSFSKPTSLI